LVADPVTGKIRQFLLPGTLAPTFTEGVPDFSYAYDARYLIRGEVNACTVSLRIL
jgi:hypothetical protein